MFKRFKLRHLRPEEFVNLADGLDLGTDRSGHVHGCSECRATLASITELQRDLTSSEDTESALYDVNWIGLRSSVRDRLLARAVKRSSSLQRWTGWRLKPAAAWSLLLLTLASGITLGGLWHYRTAHFGGTAAEAFRTPAIIEETVPAVELDASNEDAVAAEWWAWSQAEIFSSLSELNAGEEEALRELISLAVSGDSFLEEGLLQ